MGIFSKINKGMYVYIFLLGATISLIIMYSFISSIQIPSPNWGTYWQFKPLILGPIIAGLGMILAYMALKYMMTLKLPKILSYLFALIIFIIILWVSMVLGFNGTLWD